MARLFPVFLFITAEIIIGTGHISNAFGFVGYTAKPEALAFGSYEPESSPPANDYRINAIGIYTDPYVIEMDTSGATTSWDDPVLSCAGQGSHSVWFRLNAALSGIPYQISTAGSGYDTVVAVFASERGNLTEVACNDDYLGELQSFVQFTPTLGPDYYLIEVTAFGASSGGRLALRVNSLVPGNDECTSATLIPDLPFTLIQDATYARQGEFDPPLNCGSPSEPKGSHSVWYRFTPVRSALYEADTYNSSYDTVLAVLRGPCAGQQVLACNDDDQSNQSRVQWEGIQGETYYLEITSYGLSPAGELHLHVRTVPPENDSCQNALALTGDYEHYYQTTHGATTDANEPVPACSPLHNSVWFSYVRPGNGVVILSTNGSDFDTVVSVYSGTCGDGIGMVQVACNDDAIGAPNRTRTSAVAFQATGGVTYYLQIGSYVQGATGNLVLHLNSGPPCQPIAQVKALPPGSRVTVCNSVVTGYFYGFPEIQQLDGASGLHLTVSGLPLDPGTLVVSTGEVKRTAHGNLFVCSYPDGYVGTGFHKVPAPLGMGNKSVGGSDFYQQKGAPGGYGLNNVSLLVRVWGRVTAVDPVSGYYWIDDGSGLMQGYANRKGLMIWTDKVNVPAVDDYVSVVGSPWIWEPNGQAIIRQFQPPVILEGLPMRRKLPYARPPAGGVDPLTAH